MAQPTPVCLNPEAIIIKLNVAQSSWKIGL